MAFVKQIRQHTGEWRLLVENANAADANGVITQAASPVTMSGASRMEVLSVMRRSPAYRREQTGMATGRDGRREKSGEKCVMRRVGKRTGVCRASQPLLGKYWLRCGMLARRQAPCATS